MADRRVDKSAAGAGAGSCAEETFPQNGLRHEVKASLCDVLSEASILVSHKGPAAMALMTKLRHPTAYTTPLAAKKYFKEFAMGMAFKVRVDKKSGGMSIAEKLEAHDKKNGTSFCTRFPEYLAKGNRCTSTTLVCKGCVQTFLARKKQDTTLVYGGFYIQLATSAQRVISYLEAQDVPTAGARDCLPCIVTMVRLCHLEHDFDFQEQTYMSQLSELPDGVQTQIVTEIKRLKQFGVRPSAIIEEIKSRWGPQFPNLNLVDRADLDARSRLSTTEKLLDASQYVEQLQADADADPLFRFYVFRDKSTSPPTFLGAVWATAAMRREAHLCKGFLGWDTTHHTTKYNSLAGFGTGVLPTWKTAIFFAYVIPAESNDAIEWLCKKVHKIYPDMDGETALHQSDRGAAFVSTIPKQFPSGHLGTCVAPPHFKEGNRKAVAVSVLRAGPALIVLPHPS